MQFEVASQVFSELLNILQQRQHIVKHLQSIPASHPKSLPRSLLTFKQRQLTRIQTQDHLLCQITPSLLTKPLKHLLTNFVFDCVQLLSPQLAFRVERHYVNIGKLCTGWNGAAIGQGNRIEAFIPVIKAIVNDSRDRFAKELRDLAERERRGREEGEHTEREAAETVVFSNRMNLHTRRSIKKSICLSNTVNLNNQLIENKSLTKMQTKLKHLDQILQCLQNTNQLPKATYRIGTSTQPISINGSSRDFSNQLNPIHNARKRLRRLNLHNANYNPPSSRYVTDTSTCSRQNFSFLKSGTQSPKNQEKRTTPMEYIKERLHTCRLIDTPKVSSLELPTLTPKKINNSIKNAHNYERFLEMYGGCIVQLANGVDDVDKEYLRHRRRYNPPYRQSWIKDNMDSVFYGFLSQNSETTNTINKFNSDFQSWISNQPRQFASQPHQA